MLNSESMITMVKYSCNRLFSPNHLKALSVVQKSPVLTESISRYKVISYFFCFVFPLFLFLLCISFSLYCFDFSFFSPFIFFHLLLFPPHFFLLPQFSFPLFSHFIASPDPSFLRADSVAWNPHKMLGVCLQCSAFLVKHKVGNT